MPTQPHHLVSITSAHHHLQSSPATINDHSTEQSDHAMSPDEQAPTRCHVAHSNVATRQQMTTSFIVIHTQLSHPPFRYLSELKARGPKTFTTPTQRHPQPPTATPPPCEDDTTTNPHDSDPPCHSMTIPPPPSDTTTTPSDMQPH